VHSPVSVLGEETGDRLGGVVGTHHQPTQPPGHRVLGDHPLACLDVAEDEVLGGVTVVGHARCPERLGHDVTDGTYVHRQTTVRGGEVHRPGGVVLVLLRPVGQTHRHVLGVVSLLPDTIDCEATQTAGHERVQATADAGHQRGRTCGGQAFHEEGDASVDLGVYVEIRGNIESSDDFAACRAQPGDWPCGTPCAVVLMLVLNDRHPFAVRTVPQGLP